MKTIMWSVHSRPNLALLRRTHVPHRDLRGCQPTSIPTTAPASPLVTDLTVDGVQPRGAEPAVEFGRVEFDVLEVAGESRLADEIVHRRYRLAGSAVSVS